MTPPLWQKGVRNYGAVIFSHSEGCLFTLLRVSFVVLLSVLLCYYYKNRGKLAIYFIYLLLLLLLFIFVVGQRGPAQAWAWDSHRVTLSLAPALCQG